MKSNLFALAILASMLSVTLAFGYEKINQVHSEVMLHVQNSMQDIPIMPRSSDQLACYDVFVPKIDRITKGAKDTSQTCIEASKGEKESASNTLSATRATLVEAVQKIQRSLSACSEKTDNSEYFICLRDGVEENKNTLDEIRNQSVAALSSYSSLIESVQRTENTCLRNAVDAAKDESDQAFVELKTCLNYDSL